MTIRSAARVQFLTDVLTTAVEGGINHWAAVGDYRWDRERWAPEQIGVTVYDQVDDESGPWRITPASIASAVHRIVRSVNGGDVELGLHPRWRRDIARASRANDAGDIDAGLADVIVQIACHGSVIYG